MNEAVLASLLMPISILLVSVVVWIVVVKRGELCVAFAGVSCSLLLLTIAGRSVGTGGQASPLSFFMQGFALFLFCSTFHFSVLLIYLKNLPIGVFKDSTEKTLRQLSQMIERNIMMLGFSMPMFSTLCLGTFAYIFGNWKTFGAGGGTWNSFCVKSKQQQDLYIGGISLINCILILAWAFSWYRKRNKMVKRYQPSQREYFRSLRESNYLILKIFVNFSCYLSYSIVRCGQLVHGNSDVSQTADMFTGLLFLILFGASKFVIRTINLKLGIAGKAKTKSTGVSEATQPSIESKI